MMKTIRIGAYGATPMLEDIGVPPLAPDQVLVRVAAASLNPLDVKLRSGAMHEVFPLHFPYTLGSDLAGTVEQVGAAVIDRRPGDRVVARLDPTSGGAFAELAVLPSHYLAPAPRDLPLAEAAGIPTAAGTAWQALFEVAKLQAGQTVLIHAGAGAVGSFAIQLARAAGARVIATASSDGVAIARRLGADQVIDHREASFADKVSDVDLVIDTIGGETQQRSYGVMRAGGMLVAMTMPPDEALARAHGITAAFVFHQSDAARLARIVERIDAGAVQVLVDRIVPLADFQSAFDHQVAGHARGKIIVVLR